MINCNFKTLHVNIHLYSILNSYQVNVVNKSEKEINDLKTKFFLTNHGKMLETGKDLFKIEEKTNYLYIPGNEETLKINKNRPSTANITTKDHHSRKHAELTRIIDKINERKVENIWSSEKLQKLIDPLNI